MMKKVLATTLGVLLATATVSAFADKQDRLNLTQCKADVTAHYGEGTRARLRSIKREPDATHMRLMVRAAAGGNTLVVCSVDSDGSTSLADREGMALMPVDGLGAEAVSYVKPAER